MALTIKPQGQNLTMYQGAGFEKTFTAKDANGANVTISSGTLVSKMKKNYSTTNTSFILTFNTSVDGSNVTISSLGSNTATMQPGLYVYDVDYTQADGTSVEKVVHGMITVIPESTT